MEVDDDDVVMEIQTTSTVIEVDDDDDIVMEVSVLPDVFNNIPDNPENDLLFEPIRLTRCMSLDIHKRMITHVIWPRKLPSKTFDIDSSEHETALIALMLDTLECIEITNDWLASSVKLFLGLYNMNTSPDAEIIASEINRLTDGDMFGYFVKSQNCGISIYMPPRDASSIDPKSVIVSTFPVLISNEEIYSASHSEFQMELPNQSVEVALSTMLTSKDFSQQLKHLNKNPVNGKRGGNNTYVSQWLVPILSTHRSSILQHNEMAIISKKIRDDVIGQKPPMEPFRRCAHWTFLKAMLQFNLTVQWGEVNGKIMYKLVMLKVMAMLCNYYGTKIYTKLNVDVVLHMLAKLARRIEKIDHLLAELDDDYNSDKFETFPNGFEDTHNTIIGEVKHVISEIKSKLDQQIGQVQEEHEEKSTLVALTDLDFEADVHQKIPKLRQYLTDRNASTPANDNNGSMIVKSYTRHAIGSVEAPDVELFDKLKDPENIGIFLCDFENWILYERCDVNIGPECLRSLSTAYARLAAQHYKNNPLGFSRTILTQTKILTLLDKIATEAHEMFKKHRAGINPDIYDHLILPQYADCEIANDLKKYFLKRSKAKFPSLIEETKMTPNSFSVRYAQEDDDMQDVIKRIEESTEAAMIALEREYDKRRKEVADMRKRLERTECAYTVKSKGKREHRNSCARCKLMAKISGVRVTTIEDPLPQSAHEKNAVAFELHIPIEIACLRDVLHVVVGMLNEPAKQIRIHEKWTSLNVLEEFNECSTQIQRVFLGTSIKGKHGRTRNSGVHPDQPFDSCKLANNRNCILYASCDKVALHIPTNVNNQSASKSASLTVEKGSPYECLQWTVSGTVHTQNQVIARQSECPQSLTLCEFKHFGSLRADGHRLQIRKLYAMIETECLSFETLSVQALIMQTLWQKGPSNPLADRWNESHADFTDPKFCGAMVQLIDKFIDTQKSNWKHPLKLLMAVLIAVRIFEMNEDDDVADRIVQLLVKLRDIAYDWIAKVQKAMHEAPGDVKDDVEILRMNLVEIAIAGALTFSVHFLHRHLDKIFIGSVTNNITAVRFWLMFLVTINGNILMSDRTEADNIQSSQLNQQMLRQLVKHTAVQIESKVKGMIVNDPSDVFDFVKSQWNLSRDGVFHLIAKDDHPETLIISATIGNVENLVQIGILTGTFLVNNLPVSRLPRTITEHSVYQRIFDKFIFEVQESNGSFDTKYQYKGQHYSFRGNGDDSGVIVTERRKNGDEWEHVPRSIFANEIPHLLVENHSHWWCKAVNKIEFRPIRFNDADFSLPKGVQYVLDLNDGKLLHKKTEKVMLDITSQTYTKIVTQLARLESSRYIHIFMEKPVGNQRIAKVELVRMNIKFLVDASTQQQSYEIVSNEFNGMTVSLKQNCGTLYGLQKGLLLESSSNDGKTQQNKLLILPHGNVSARIMGNHENVDINVESTALRNPPYFTYQLDETCQQLKASNRSYSAWFYLAYLHALTSHGLPEPFTRMSGTERSMQILQSAFAWSPSPYDEEASTTLQLIRKLAPTRRIKNNMQWFRWPDFIESHAAQDGFLCIANRLISDSVRLEDLYLKDKVTSKVSTTKDKDEANNSNTEIESGLDVNVREYYRCLPYFPNLQLSETFVKQQAAISTHYIHNENDQNLNSVRTISNLYHQQKFVPPKSFSLTDYLTKDDDDLNGSLEMDDKDQIVDLFSAKDVRSVWLPLYNIARSGQFNCEKFALVLGLLAYESTRKDDLAALQVLQTVAANATIFNGLEPPTEVNTFYLNDRPFNYRSIENILEEHVIDRDDFGRRFNEMREIKHLLSVRDYIHKIVTKIRSMWPCDRVDASIYQLTHPDVNIRDAVTYINKKLKHWRDIDQLMVFLGHFDIQVRHLSTTVPLVNDELAQWCPEKIRFKSFTKFYVDFDAKIIANLSQFDTEVMQSKQIFADPSKITEEDWWGLYILMASPNDVRHFVDSGMYPRLVLSLVLPKLLSPTTQNPDLRSIITAVGMQIVHEQRARRISVYAGNPDMHVALEQEQNTEPHTNWQPYENPEWLIFEIEQNLTIRPIQIEVAERMIDPPDVGTKHSVMQLNMGEGKTSVICPLLASKLANGKQLCQVTVLKSLFGTNLKEFRQCLGGMLNRRLYTFPCRRDMPIERYCETILDLYVECRRLKGVVLTLPEFRLSFQLKIYEAPSKNELEYAGKLLQIHNWLNQNARNILDESDAILQPKYQLIYTLGQQISLDGGAQRWTVIQALLKRLPIYLYKLSQKFGDDKMEFSRDYVKNGHVAGHVAMDFRSDVFTPCRIFDSSVYNELKLKLIDDLVDGHLSLSLVHQTKQTLKLWLNEGDVSANDYNDLMRDLSSAQQTVILILSGFLRFNVLQLVLGKRWRVNYGVNDHGPRKMAIPFKAKDVAAEMTEFGHPDVAICLTQLSYYYSGLSETQLREVFRILESQQNSAEIYAEWINSVPHELVPDSIISYTGVNLSDPKQRNELVFPLLKHNMYVIDYWLSNLVYPREAKTFEHKLMCTAWDLVSDNFAHTVSGFSGTNDTKNILPLPIKQNDLKQLEQTNDNVRSILLRQENSGYVNLLANVRGPDILVMLRKLKIPVLLDAGACMLELNNEQVASQWLDIVDANVFDATVYFNKNDVLMTVDRNGIRTEFDCSVYRNKLDRCLVYLDDVHTRGIDLKFPLGWKACVTLSGDITRDKTVQACMRMRLLGHINGHSIVFIASNEAHHRILEQCNLKQTDKPTSKDVLEFVTGNSERYEQENAVHWSAAAYNYTKKLVAHKIYENSDEVDALQELHSRCKDNEYVTLKDMYGIKESALLTQISKNQFDKMIQAHQNETEIVELVTSIYDGVGKKLSQQAPKMQRYTQSFDEEQEKELEHELEEQRQIERPAPAIPAQPVFDEMLENLIKSGVTSQSFRKMRFQKTILSFHESLADKSMYRGYKVNASPWSENLYVTSDFVSVVEGGNSEDYLRPVWWIAHIIHREGDDIFLLLSSHEANMLLPLFRKSTRAALMCYRPRLSQMHSNLLNEDTLQVTGINTLSGVRIKVNDEVQIAMYSGSMYFRYESEQDSYCSFMGLIPKPRSAEQQLAFEEGIITPSSYVLPENRRHSAAISELVKDCKFQRNPIELAIKIIEAHHVFVRKESHVAAILEKATKKEIN